MSDHKHNSIDYVEFSGKNSDSITQIKNFYSDAFNRLSLANFII